LRPLRQVNFEYLEVKMGEEGRFDLLKAMETVEGVDNFVL
jgi:hypothetical protein